MKVSIYTRLNILQKKNIVHGMVGKWLKEKKWKNKFAITSFKDSIV